MCENRKNLNKNLQILWIQSNIPECTLHWSRDQLIQWHLKSAVDQARQLCMFLFIRIKELL